jgi:uncharacterized protein (DUF697 family)
MYETEFELSSESYEFPGEAEWEMGQEAEGENLEAELAGELLEITTEAELDRFLGKLASSVMKGASTFIKSPIGKAVGGVLKNVAKKALPAVGGALGSMVLPGVGTAIGAKLGSMAGGLLETGEAETMSEVEAEYETAQRYVRFARAAIGNAARAPRDIPQRAVVRAATVSAARRYAPSLLKSSRPGQSGQQGQRSSQWRRRRYQEPRPWSYAEPVAYWDEPEPWSTNGDGAVFDADEEAPGRGGGSGGQKAEGRWVRRGGRIVLLGA